MPITIDEPEVKRMYIGTRFADKVEKGAQNLMIGAANRVQEMAKDQEGWTDDAIRLIGGGIKNVRNLGKDREGIVDDMFRLAGGGIKNTLKIAGLAGEVGGWAGGKAAGALGFDPRIGGVVGNVVGDAIGGFGAAKALQIGKTARRINRLTKQGHGLQISQVLKASKGKPYAFAYGDAGKHALKDPNFLDAAFANKKARKTIAKMSRQSADEQQLLQAAADLKLRKTLDAPGYRMNRSELKSKIIEMQDQGIKMPQIKEELLGNKNAKWIDDVTGERINIQVNTKNPSQPRFIGQWSLDRRAARRFGSAEIPREEVQRLASKYHQKPDVVEKFMEYQEKGHKEIKDLVKKINKRIAKNRKVYGPTLKASKGHGKATIRYKHSGDVISNLELEDHVTNITRSNKDELSDGFNRALGRSINLEEEFLKFIDPDLGSFHKEAFRLGRHQKDNIIKYVADNMDKNIDWKELAEDGTQLFRNKEEFLINEALEKFALR